ASCGQASGDDAVSSHVARFFCPGPTPKPPCKFLLSAARSLY
ncbi:hypothetical protein A2U01_0081344, partial [Trifolium medium]|nr:hypothetical protein [Trifolium medium]